MNPTANVRHISTRLGRLRVSDVGDGEPLLLWHSLFVDGASFDRLLPYVSQGRRTIVVDGPDHGRSETPAGLPAYDLEACADAALELLDALGVHSVDWIGSAWGGHVGAVLAARRTGRVRSLAALGSPMQPPGDRGRLHALVFLFGLIGARGPVASALVNVLLDPRTRAEDPEAVRYVLEAVIRPPRRGLKRAMVSVMLGRPSLIERLERIDVPTLFVTGDDPIWTFDQARAQAARIPKGRSLYIPGARHLPMLERAEATGTVLRSWLEEARHAVPGATIDPPG